MGYISVLIGTIILLIPQQVSAARIYNRGSQSSFEELMYKWSDSINSAAPTISFFFNAIFTIMFLYGVIRMGYSMVTKTGQVMKFSTNLMIWVPITVFLIRVLVLIMFTTTEKNVTLLASDMISLIQHIGYYFAIGMILIGLSLYLFHRLIRHPEYGRWSKRLWSLAGATILLVTIMPYVLGAAT